MPAGANRRRNRLPEKLEIAAVLKGSSVDKVLSQGWDGCGRRSRAAVARLIGGGACLAGGGRGRPRVRDGPEVGSRRRAIVATTCLKESSRQRGGSVRRSLAVRSSTDEEPDPFFPHQQSSEGDVPRLAIWPWGKPRKKRHASFYCCRRSRWEPKRTSPSLDRLYDHRENEGLIASRA